MTHRYASGEEPMVGDVVESSNYDSDGDHIIDVEVVVPFGRSHVAVHGKDRRNGNERHWLSFLCRKVSHVPHHPAPEQPTHPEITAAVEAAGTFSQPERVGGEAPFTKGIYVASRASIPERSAMWRSLRADGVSITSTWIDEAGEGETADWGELWSRIVCEIKSSRALILYAEPGDFPLKGAYVEVGIALGLGIPIVAVLPGVELEPRSGRPVGSWLSHPLVSTATTVVDAVVLINSDCTLLPAPPPEREPTPFATLAADIRHDFAAIDYDDVRDLIAAAEGEIGELRAKLGEAEAGRDAWQDSAAQFLRNQEFYHGLVTKIGEGFGTPAYTSDDGSVQDSVLALKVPELVDSLRTENQRLAGEVKEAQIAMNFAGYGPSTPAQCIDALAKSVVSLGSELTAATERVGRTLEWLAQNDPDSCDTRHLASMVRHLLTDDSLSNSAGAG